MRILIFHYGKITGYPPVISLVQNLINNKHMVTVISENLGALPSSITGSNCFKGIESLRPSHMASVQSVLLLMCLFGEEKLKESLNKRWKITI